MARTDTHSGYIFLENTVEKLLERHVYSEKRNHLLENIEYGPPRFVLIKNSYFELFLGTQCGEEAKLEQLCCAESGGAMFCGDRKGNTSNGFYNTLHKLVSEDILQSTARVTAFTEHGDQAKYLQELGFSVDRNTRSGIFRSTVQQLLERSNLHV